jgi:hypothetical protein
VNNELTSLFGTSTSSGQKIGSGLARQVRQQSELVIGQAEVAKLREDARSFVASGVMGNISMLVGEAEQIIRLNPSATAFLEPVIIAVAMAGANAVRNL